MELLQTNPLKEEKQIIEFLQKTLAATPFSKYIVGMSGGIDSTVVATLITKSVGPQNLYCAFFPYRNLAKGSLIKAKRVCDILTIPVQNRIEINIENIVDTIISQLQKDTDNTRRGNIMARVRMILLYDQARKLKALVCGTENKSEHLLGYFTRFGDQASDVEPIRHLYKTQLKNIAQHLGIPKEIINSPPTAGLWPDQTDEGEFGFTYEEADKILFLRFDRNLSASKIVNNGFSKDLVHKVLKRAEDNSFKHHLPIFF